MELIERYYQRRVELSEADAPRTLNGYIMQPLVIYTRKERDKNIASSQESYAYHPIYR